MSRTLVPYTDVDRLFRSFWDVPAARAATYAPAADVSRDGDDLVARFDLPGIDPEQDVTVELEGRKLVVRGERQDTREQDGDGRRVREVRYGGFRRIVTLPGVVDPAAVSATYDAGVLTVTVAGAYSGSNPTRIEVARAA
ncbi:HSP20 family molecular chaperone IbpA [Haloactinopolyspora alba]|uniref:HSP20 family molecular chaperone IbpA n=1 Tax=Haloactinopolyspora alba TaxID=648780 RepID=A0A2P8DLX0_9ACTN|nr:Hsp20/alpha crystallin family protein [Haloactinopolyspora alba]PSK98233.1 HSP20 family molecular chaperone IbpA [Haloactinopolyspora alba]